MEDEQVTPSDQVVITRRILLIAGIIIAVASILLIGAGVGLYLKISSESTARSKANAARIAEFNRLTKPTPKQYRRQLRQGFKRCAEERLCVGVLRRLLRKGSRPSPEATPKSGVARPQGTPGTDGVSTEGNEGSGGPSDRSLPARPPRREPPSPAPERPPPASSPSPPPENGGSPTVDIHIPVGPQLCGAVSLNC